MRYLNQMVNVLRLDREPNETELSELRQIFFLCSSRKSFESESQKERFFQTWVGYYLSASTEWLFLAKSKSSKVLGYLTGCTDSHAASSYYVDRLKSYSVFSDQFDAFPAHLHINCHPDAQGQGVGGKLMDEYLDTLEQKSVKGVHLVTSPDARNVKFYQKLGFDFELTREFEGCPLLFMGKRISG